MKALQSFEELVNIFQCTSEFVNVTNEMQLLNRITFM
jgi:hypothetical protein